MSKSPQFFFLVITYSVASLIGPPCTVTRIANGSKSKTTLSAIYSGFILNYKCNLFTRLQFGMILKPRASVQPTNYPKKYFKSLKNVFEIKCEDCAIVVICNSKTRRTLAFEIDQKVLLIFDQYCLNSII